MKTESENSNDIQENNNEHLLEILACDETLQDFEEYLLKKGFNDMMLCITSTNEIERQRFDYFFKYFNIDIDTKNENENEKTNLLHRKLLISNLQKELLQLKDNTLKKHKLLAIIAVALQNCKLREQFYPEGCGAKDFSTNLLPLLSQAQYFLRFAENCNASFSTMNIFDKKIEQKKINIIDTNNFLYSNAQMMPVHKSGTIEENCKKHFRKISQTIAEKSQQQKQQYNVKIINIVPTSHHWGTQQNPHIIEEYNTISNGNKDIEYRILFNIDKKDEKGQYIYNNDIRNNIKEMTNNNKQIQLYDGKKRNQTPFPKNDNHIIVNYLNSGDHLVFPPNEGYDHFNANNVPTRGSTDVAMTRTDYFTHLGANGNLGNNGVFMFNDTKSQKKNFQSLRMPTTFMFKGEKIDALNVIKPLIPTIITSLNDNKDEKNDINDKTSNNGNCLLNLISNICGGKICQ